MKTGNILRTIGSITKKESLANVSGDIIKNTTVAEADKPYSHYYGQLPEKTKPNSLFIFTENEYSLEEALRYTQNIEFCSKNQVNVASAIIYFAEHTVPALRIRNFPDYQHIPNLQHCYIEQKVKLIKHTIPSKEFIIKVTKCFTLEDVGDGYFFDLNEANEGYFIVPEYPEFTEFESLIQKIRNNSSCSLFDAAMGGLIINGKVFNIVRIYSEHITIDMLKLIRKEALRWMERKNKVKPLPNII